MLKPGQYNLRVALRDGKKLGLAEMPVTVDDYEGKQLALSGIALAKRFRKAPTTPQSVITELPENYMPLVSQGVEVTPAADARFQKSDPFYFYFEIYHPEQTASPAATVQAHLRIVKAKTGQAVKDLPPVNAASYAKPDDPVIPIGGGIDISSFSKGSYELQVQATDSAGNTTPWRTVKFTIE